ncbi:MAG: GerMN domain-containing protein [Streptosporangiales bacterium]|nr:GerMN domain-containing protein [Streptosporangiales bacterium]MBO0892666.1 GerMN domain-containing protein [Acidothermales bacterium]
MSHDERDELERRLRDALHNAVEDVQPRGDGLGRIRERIETGGHRGWWARLRGPWLTSPAFAAASLVGVIGLGVVVTVGIGQETGIAPPLGHATSEASTTISTSASETPPPTRSPEPAKTTPHTTTPAPTHSTTTAPPRPETVSVPVYFITRTRDGYGVSRTSTSTTVEGGKKHQQDMRAKAAYDAIFTRGPNSTSAGLWQPGTSVVDASVAGDTVRVDLSGSASSGTEQSADAARAALKQLVYTGLDAVPSASSVQVRVGGAEVSSFWNILTVNAGGVTRDDEALTRPLNTITAPKPGASVTSPVRLQGTGAYAGGTVYWTISSGDKTMAAQTGKLDTGTNGFTNWTYDVTLQPGTYTAQVYEQVNGETRNAQEVTFTVTS